MKKKLLTLILLLVTVFGVFAVSNLKNVEAKTMTGGEVLYLLPNSNWRQSNARFAAYFFGNGESWASMTKCNYDSDYYKVTVPSGNWTNVIFCRMNPSASANNWNNKWNQTLDLTYDGSNNCYTVKDGTWDKGGGTWSAFEETLAGTQLRGDFNNWEKNVDVFVGGVIELELEAKTYEFKLVHDGKWYGNDGTIDADIAGWLFETSKNNCTLKITKAGKYLFEFDSNSKKLSVSYVPTVYENLISTFEQFYNSGSYTKETIININTENEDLELELIQHFHAATNSLDRVQTAKTTYYSGDILWFVDGHGYGKSEDNKLTSIKVENNDPTKVTVRSTTASLPGMEDYYCTLDDFIKGSHNSKHSNNETLDLVNGWSYEVDDEGNGIYKNEQADVIDAFILFTAPTWLDTDMGNYLDYTHVTVQVVENQLVMKLWVSSTELGGKLIADAEVVGGYAVFSQATISKGIVA